MKYDVFNGQVRLGFTFENKRKREAAASAKRGLVFQT